MSKDTLSILNRNFGRMIQKLNWDQKRAAAAMGLKHYTLSRYLAGKTDPGIKGLEKIAKGFGITVSELLDPEKPPSARFAPISAMDALVAIEEHVRATSDHPVPSTETIDEILASLKELHARLDHAPELPPRLDLATIPLPLLWALGAIDRQGLVTITKMLEALLKRRML